MKRNNIEGSISAKCLAGHATELTVWKFIQDISSQLTMLHKEGIAHGAISLNNICVNNKDFTVSKHKGIGAISDDVWQLGACIHELITGNIPFGSNGQRGQSAQSPLPVYSASRASRTLSELTAKCLDFDNDKRISIENVSVIATQELHRQEQYYSNLDNLKYKQPQNRKIRMKTYDFWPEAMICIIFFIMVLIPRQVFAQDNAEMEKLIHLTITMRDQSKRAQVLKELKEDDKWTLMDELKRDMNECSWSDKVNMFGINDIAAEIAQQEKGIVNVGGRFKHSADGKHQYSFIELTALAGTTITYEVKGHKGVQQVAIVPFDPKSEYTALFYSDGVEHVAQTQKDGISYFSINVGIRGNYEFEIKNNNNKNCSFAVVTYNSMK